LHGQCEYADRLSDPTHAGRGERRINCAVRIQPYDAAYRLTVEQRKITACDYLSIGLDRDDADLVVGPLARIECRIV
jgi:hypothetical protein